MNRKHIVFSGFMLFSLFFGAGNLIFPPLLGLEAGESFTPAMIGFLITGVLLPFMAIMAVALSDDGLISIGSRVHPVFGLVFAIIIYMSIGAFYGIPRASNVAYELGFRQVVGADNGVVLLLFSIVFFGLTYFISFNPTKIVDRIGQILTPLLLFVLALLFIQAFWKFDNIAGEATGDYAGAPFVTGFLEGYFTMDAVAALAFGIVVINGLKDKGAKTKQDLVKGSIGAAVLAGIGLTVVYVSLGWIGSVIPGETVFTNGAEILTESAEMLFVQGGALLFGIIVMLACLTTCVGLINACSRFFHDIFPRYSYKVYVTIFVLIGLLVSNLGLNIILDIATPLLVFIYPIAIVLIFLALLQQVVGAGPFMYRLPVAITSVYALYEVLASLGIEVTWLKQGIGFVPFFQAGLGWIVPAFVFGLVGYVLDHNRKTINERKNLA